MQPYRKWAILALLNLLIVAAAGVLLRYKILFPLPAVGFKNLLHAHSHFAFSGWISLGLFVTITGVLHQYKTPPPVYTKLFILAQVAAFGMLFTFTLMGYKAPSIFFSTVSILFSYVFAVAAWKTLRSSRLPATIANWFKAALFFYVLSSAGALYLAWLMASKTGTQYQYVGSVYFFLHFQYNGWFLFSLAGLFFFRLHQLQVTLAHKAVHKIFCLLFISCMPAYLLSALWMPLPGWLYRLAVVAAAVQVFAFILFCKLLWPARKQLAAGLYRATRWLWLVSFCAFGLKILLQAMSVIPALHHLAFGFRPVVIGYLHLIFLLLVTLFLLGCFLQQRLLLISSGIPAIGLVVFVTGVLLNEFLLMLQGFAAIYNTGMPAINYYLLYVALLMLVGLTLLVAGQWQKQVSYKGN